MTRFLTTSCFALALAACGGTDGVDVTTAELKSEPPIWSVTDADSEVILYPTFHVLPEELQWKSDTLTAALDRAGEVWYEIPAGADDDPQTQALVMQYGMSQDMPLSEKLPAATREKLESVLADMGVPAEAVEPMQPWMAAVSLPLIQLMQGGYSPESGVETQLQAITGDKGQRAFETMEQQLRFFADMDADAQVAMLDETLADMGEGTAMIDRIAAAWSTGDLATLEDEFITEMKGDYPALYDVLITGRNTNWATQLDTEMQGAGVDFVAVGAGHLIGPDSVPAMMAAKGYEVKILTLAE